MSPNGPRARFRAGTSRRRPRQRPRGFDARLSTPMIALVDVGEGRWVLGSGCTRMRMLTFRYALSLHLAKCRQCRRYAMSRRDWSSGRPRRARRRRRRRARRRHTPRLKRHRAAAAEHGRSDQQFARKTAVAVSATRTPARGVVGGATPPRHRDVSPSLRQAATERISPKMPSCGPHRRGSALARGSVLARGLRLRGWTAANESTLPRLLA